MTLQLFDNSDFQNGCFNLFDRTPKQNSANIRLVLAFNSIN